MKKMIQLAVAGVAVLALSNTQVLAHDLDLEDDMAEGITLSEQSPNTATYKYDSVESGAQESMTEAVFFPESNQSAHHYAGDPSTPSADALMVEGICMKTFRPLMATR